jgi:tetratricopeptide (TPR) repeat protein
LSVYRLLGFAQSEMEDLYGALENYEKALKLALEDLRRNPSDARARRLMAEGYARTGEITARTGAVGLGLEKIGRAMEMYEAVAAENLENAKAQGDIARTAILRGDMFGLDRKDGDAARQYRRALEISEKLAAADPSNKQWEANRVIAMGRLAEALVKSGQMQEARAVTVRALATLKPLVEKPEPTQYDLQQYCWMLLTTPFAELRDSKTARHIAERLVAATNHNDAAALDMLARAHDALGDTRAAIETERRARALLPADSSSSMKKDIEANLAKLEAKAAQ